MSIDEPTRPDSDDTCADGRPPRQVPPGAALFPPERDPLHGRTAFAYRPGRLVCHAADTATVLRRLADLEVSVEHHGPLEKLGLDEVVFHERPGVEAPRLVERLRREERCVRVQAVHVLTPSSHILMSPARPPHPAPALTVAPPRAHPHADGEAPVTIGVLDSGADHSAFGGLLAAGSNADPVTLTAPGRRLACTAGHGTFVTGVALDRAYRAPGRCRPVRALVRRVLDDHGLVDDVELALRLVDVAAHVDVLCLPMAGYAQDDGSASLQLEAALDAATAAHPDLVVVAAAGNQASARPSWPAMHPAVIAVAALDGDGNRACFSNYGWWVRCCAPGVDLESDFLTWAGELDLRWASVPDPGSCTGDTFDPSAAMAFSGRARWSGTSFATAVVAGAVAGAIAAGSAPADAVATLLDAPGVASLPDLGSVVL